MYGMEKYSLLPFFRGFSELVIDYVWHGKVLSFAKGPWLLLRWPTNDIDMQQNPNQLSKISPG